MKPALGIVLLLCAGLCGCGNPGLSTHANPAIKSATTNLSLPEVRAQPGRIQDLHGQALLTGVEKLLASDPGAVLEVFGTLSWEDNQALLELLDEKGPPVIIPGLVRQAIVAVPAQQQPALLWSVAKLAQKKDLAGAQQEAKKYLASSNPIQARRATLLMAVLSGNPTFLGNLGGFLGRGTVWEQWEAVFAIGQIDGYEATQLLASQIKPEVPAVVAGEAARQLARRPFNTALEALRAAQRHPAEEVRKQVEQALAVVNVHLAAQAPPPATGEAALSPATKEQVIFTQ